MKTYTLNTTASRSFFSCSGGNETLFAVRPGIDAFAALEMASCLLSVARTCAIEADESDDLSSAAAYLTDMAKAVIDSVMLGSKARPDDCALANAFDRLTALRESGTLIIAPGVSSIAREDAEGFLCWAGRQVKGGAQ